MRSRKPGHVLIEERCGLLHWTLENVEGKLLPMIYSVLNCQEAYAKALQDPELLLETEKARMDVDLTPGEELEELIKKVMDQPKEVMERVKKMLGN